MAIQAGTLIGRYQIDTELGRGAQQQLEAGDVIELAGITATFGYQNFHAESRAVHGKTRSSGISDACGRGLPSVRQDI